MSTFISSDSLCGGEKSVPYPAGVLGEHVLVTSVPELFLMMACTIYVRDASRFLSSTTIVDTCPSLIGDGTSMSIPNTIGVGVGVGVSVGVGVGVGVDVWVGVGVGVAVGVGVDVGVGVASAAVVPLPQLLHTTQCFGARSDGAIDPMIANQYRVSGLRPVRVVVIEGSVTCCPDAPGSGRLIFCNLTPLPLSLTEYSE